uniref:leucyl/phenylalanyl-tRNA--protein transferase n=1 Tax=Thaumasiovibrio occultus TaxID=1891184 RepID=UPI000B35F05D|nr:leucyl/phenylalanyl-tRNA--protein transferase [Thaumasiovibrio occultus]
MALYLPELSPTSLQFPHPTQALTEPNGLLAFGGDLSPERLIAAYRQGIFPWFSLGEPILWWSPAPRTVFICEQYAPSRSTRRFQNKHNYRVTINYAFDQVIDLCADTRGIEETWISAEMKTAYKQLHQLGHAHSVEVWKDEQLVGGMYGIGIGQLFCGESMFSLADNASKIALWYFNQHFVRCGGQLLDCQVMNPHLASLGAVKIDQAAFLDAIAQLQAMPLADHCFKKQVLSL